MRASRTVRRLLAARPWAFTLLAAALLGSCGKDEVRAHQGRTYAEDGILLGASPSNMRRVNLVLIIVDTLRADALGGGEQAPARMPWLEGLARRGTRFTQVAATAPWTLPSIGSLLTGLAPHEHGVGVEPGMETMPAGITTFAEALRAAHGYATMAFVGGSWDGGPRSIFAGFQEVLPAFALQAVERMVWPWARERNRAQPFFLLLHTYEAHHPYGAINHPFPPLPAGAVPEGPDPVAALGPAPRPRELAELLLTSLHGGQSLRNLHRERHMPTVTRYLWRGLRDEPDPALQDRLRTAYWNGVGWVDDLLRAAVTHLREWGLLDNTLLVVTADHGEAFGEHGVLMHGRDCHDELIRVPLVLDGLPPFQGGHRVEASVSLADLLPTFFDLNGMPPLDGLADRSLLPLVESGGAGRPVESDDWVTPSKTGGEGPFYVASLRSERWKVILTRDPESSAAREEAYDLAKDPLEQENLARDIEGAEFLPFDPPFRAALQALRRRVLGPLRVPRAPPGAERGQPLR